MIDFQLNQHGVQRLVMHASLADIDQVNDWMNHVFKTGDLSEGMAQSGCQF
ncbi:hypothetical protein [Limnohabitans sp.]|uniref:hypothetical protein n=1 Tax=Limnohabitans sp. TaxID=1907725 RepID=UPI003C7894DE